MRRPTAIAAAGAAAVVAAGLYAWPGGGPADAPAPPEARAAARGAGGQEGPAAGDTATAAERAIRLHRTASRGPVQPIPFSHRFHVAELQIDCEYCHTGTRNTQVATMPALSVCMGCHQTVGGGLPAIDSLRAFWSQERPVPWERVYKVPEFVQFQHQAHLRNEIQCQECHGPVQEMDRIYKAQDLTMGWCLSCHRQEPQPTDVATTARLVDEADLPEPPTGRQPVGLYPQTIERGYASARAPDDCATCHY